MDADARLGARARAIVTSEKRGVAFACRVEMENDQ
jgi:hypothetical protein